MRIVLLLSGCVLAGLLTAGGSWAQDGSIVAWGANNTGQCNVPAPNRDFVAVAGGVLAQSRLEDRRVLSRFPWKMSGVLRA